MSDFEMVIDGIDFGEGPRWRDGELWFSDFYQRSISAVSAAGERREVWSDLEDQPSGLGWLPDGALMVVFMTSRRVMRQDGDRLVTHADLSDIATFHCNDMVVSADGNAYVGNFGFDLAAAPPDFATFQPADLALVRPDGSATVAAEAMAFPNGSVITPDGSTLIVGETFGAGYTAFTIEDDGSLTDRRRWAEIPGTAPDGCALDEEGAIWFADAVGQALVRVAEGGEVLERRPTPMPTFACMLGGDDGCTLFAFCAADSHPDVVAGTATGAIFKTEVVAGHAGRP